MIIAIHEGQMACDIQYGRIECLNGYQTMRNRTFGQETTLSAFGKSRLYPFKPAIVLERMLEYRGKCPEKGPRCPIPKTPTTKDLATYYFDQLLSNHFEDESALAHSFTPPCTAAEYTTEPNIEK
jgi:hypothetical protein